MYYYKKNCGHSRGLGYPPTYLRSIRQRRLTSLISLGFVHVKGMHGTAKVACEVVLVHPPLSGPVEVGVTL